jgi:hypothetical protein
VAHPPAQRQYRLPAAFRERHTPAGAASLEFLAECLDHEKPATHAARDLTAIDRLLIDAQNALETVLGAPRAERANPPGEADVVLDEDDRRHAAG